MAIPNHNVLILHPWDHKREKSLRKVSVKMPHELYELIKWNCDRHPPNHPKTVGGWIKDAIEFRLSLLFGNQVGCYELYKLLRSAENPQSQTKNPEVPLKR